MLRLLFSVLFLYMFLSPVFGATALTVDIQPATGQTVFPGNPARYRGSPIKLVITFSDPVNSPDIDKIGFRYSPISNISIVEVAESNKKKWLYTFSPDLDGSDTMLIDTGCATRISDGQPSQGEFFPLVLDTSPTLAITNSGSGPAITFTIKATTGVAIGETVSWNATSLAVSNGTFSVSSSINTFSSAGTYPSLTITVTPFGYGDVTLEAKPGLVRDQFGNVNLAASNSIFYVSPIIGTPPKATRVIGATKPDNTVYKTGQTLTLAVDFDRSVKIVGTNPSGIVLNLNSSGTSGSQATATFTGFASGSDSRLLFSYTILPGHRSISLDVTGTNALSLPSGTAIAGLNSPADYVAVTTLPAPGGAGSLVADSFYSINVDPSKPFPNEITSADKPGGCGAGSGIGMLLGGGSLALIAGRRRRRAA